MPTVPQNRRKILAVSPYNTEEQKKEKFVTCQGCVVVMTLSVVHWRAADIPGRSYPVEQTSPWLRYQLFMVLIPHTFWEEKPWRWVLLSAKADRAPIR